MAIAAGDAGLAEAGYATESWPWLTTVPPQYLDPDMGAILRALVNPTRWLDVWRYLLFRDGVPLPPAATVAVGLTPELAGRVTPATGPFNLSDRPGPGTEPGQFKDPIGVAVGADGVIAVVDSGNARVQRFDRDGAFLGIWGEDEGGVDVHPHRQRPRSDRGHDGARRHHLGRRHLGTPRGRPGRQRRDRADHRRGDGRHRR